MSRKKDKKSEIEDEIITEPEVKEDLKDVSETSDMENEEIEIDSQSESNHSEDLKTAEEKLEEEVGLLRDEKLRLLAEMENLRKRSERERSDLIKYGSINLARDILSPDDNLQRALEAIPQNEKNSSSIVNLIDGLKAIQREFSTILQKHGIKKIDSLNNKFDHNFHQAMVEIENDEVESGTIVQEMQSGYTMHDKLLRPSMVGVSKKTIINKEK